MKKTIFLMASVIVITVWIFGSSDFGKNAWGAQKRIAIALGTAGTGGASHGAGTGVAAVLSKNSPLRVTVNPFPSSALFMEALSNGRIEMVYTNSWEVSQQYHGIGWFKDVGKRNLRIIRLGQGAWKAGLLVRKDSEIKTVAELKGKRFVQPKGMAVLVSLNEAIIAGSGLTFEDLKVVWVASMKDAGQTMKEGRADVIQIRYGAGLIKDINSVYPLRYLDCTATSPENEKKMFEMIRGLFYARTEAGAAPWVTQDINLIGQDIALFCMESLSDDVAYTAAKVLYEHYDDLAPIHRDLKTGFKPELSVKEKFDVPFHPGAVKFYKEVGIWTSAMDQAQKDAITNQ